MIARCETVSGSTTSIAITTLVFSRPRLISCPVDLSKIAFSTTHKTASRSDPSTQTPHAKTMRGFLFYSPVTTTKNTTSHQVSELVPESFSVFQGNIMGSTVDTYSEQYRHQCECSDFVRRFWPNMFLAKEHLALIQEKRGIVARRRLQQDVLAIWSKKDSEEANHAAIV